MHRNPNPSYYARVYRVFRAHTEYYGGLLGTSLFEKKKKKTDLD